MEHKFILSCCSTADVPYDHMEKRQVSILHYTYVMDGVEYEDDMGRDKASLPQFYEWIRQGKQPSTSQVSVGRYIEYFTELLKQGDVLHLAFSSGMSGSANNAALAAREVQENFPDRKLFVVDTLCGSSGQALFADMVADLRDGGASAEEAYTWAMENRGRVHHYFFTGDMTHFRRTGRVSGPAAAVATVLNICPMMRLDDKGAIKAYDKVRGKKAAVKALVDEMETHAEGGLHYHGRCYLAHSMCPEDAAATVSAIEERFPQLKKKVMVNIIGPTIGSHTGIGTVSLYFVGDERKSVE